MLEAESGWLSLTLCLSCVQSSSTTWVFPLNKPMVYKEKKKHTFFLKPSATKNHAKECARHKGGILEQDISH